MSSSPSISPEHSTLKVKAIHTELPKPQSPLKVTKVKTDKTYAQNPDEIVPLSGPRSPLDVDQSLPNECVDELLETHVVLKGASKRWTNV